MVPRTKCSEQVGYRTVGVDRLPLRCHRLWEDHVRLGISLGYQSAWSTPADHLAMAQEADRLGFAVAWSAEAYGSDAVSMLAWIAGQTQQIDVGSAILQ